MNHLPISCARALLATLLVASLGACTKAEKPRELIELDVMWQDPETRKVKDIPGAGKYYREAYQFRLRAQEAYNDGELELSKEYAIWSVLKYRTAVAISRQYQAAERLESANKRMETVNPDLLAINQERNKLTQEVGALKIQVAQAKMRKKAEADRIAAMNAAKANGNDGADEAARVRAVDDKIAQVVAARKGAMSVEADKHAAAIFNRAENLYKSIVQMRQVTPIQYDTLMSSSDRAITGFNDAALKAKPGYKVQVAKADPAARRASLLRDAQTSFGSGNVLAEPNGVRVIASSVYDKGQTAMNSRGDTAIKAVVGLANIYDEFQITIVGFTGRGDATENLVLSQVRAKSARKALVRSGVKDDRLSDRGQGQENPRFSDASRNERLEFIFRR